MLGGMDELPMSSSSVLRGGSISELDKKRVITLLKHRNYSCTMVTSRDCSVAVTP